MSRSFRFLDLPAEVQVIVLENCIAHFSIDIDEYAQRGQPYWKAAGRKAVGGMTWVPRSLRLALRDTILQRYDGILRCSSDILANHLSPCSLAQSVYCPQRPWPAVKKLDLARTTADRRPDGLKAIGAGWTSIAWVMLQDWLPELMIIKHTVSHEVWAGSSPLSLDDSHTTALLNGSKDGELCTFLRQHIEQECGPGVFDLIQWRGREQLKLVLTVKMYLINCCLTDPGPVLVKFKIWAVDLCVQKNDNVSIINRAFEVEKFPD